jgi:predicted nucleic acid-binding protein
MTAPLRVVLDTNVVLSALVFGGSAAGQARRAWQRGVLLPLASTATVQKLVRVLAYPKFRLSRAEQDELLADYLPYTETVRLPQPPPQVPESGDRDLLAIATEFEQASGCPILTLDAFCKAYCDV